MKKSNYVMITIMFKNSLRLLLFSLILCCTSVQADVTFPLKQGAVTDQMGILSPQSSKQIEDKILSLEKTKGSQIAVLIIPTTAPLTLEQYANQLFNYWRLGRYKVDDGVLLLVALDDRAVRIEVGYGLEGTLTDLTTRNIITDYLLPYFKQERYEQGIEIAVDALIAKIKQEPLPAIDNTQFYIAKNPTNFGVIDIIAAIILGTCFYMWAVILFKLLKVSPLIVSILLVIILSITGYFGGFDINTWNGLQLGDEFLETNLPYWVQELLLKILPSWMSVLMIFTVFLVSSFLCLGLFIILSIIINKWIISTKLKFSITIGLFSGVIFGLMAAIHSDSLIYGVIFGSIITIIMGVLSYISECISTKLYRDSNLDNSSQDYSSYSSHSSSSSSSSGGSGGGGRSGGGGASGKW